VGIRQRKSTGSASWDASRSAWMSRSTARLKTPCKTCSPDEDTADPGRGLDRHCSRSAIDVVLRCLPQRDREVLELRFGTAGRPGRSTLAWVASL